jgi:polar amino acid transport system substrate-binding protein
MKPARRAFLLAFCITACMVAHARPMEAIAKSGKLIAATEGAFAPFNFFEGAKLTGFEVELTEMLARKMGVALEWKTVGFDALLTGLAQNRWDLAIASHGITDERAKAVTFMAPHYCSGGMVVSRSPHLKTAKDLAGKTVSVQTGSTYYEQVNKGNFAKTVKNYPSDSDARTALVSSRVDAWVTDRFTALETAHKNPTLKLQLGDLLFTERIAAAAAKGNTSLAQAWNKALEASFADGSYAQLSTKYFGQDVRCK